MSICRTCSKAYGWDCIPGILLHYGKPATHFPNAGRVPSRAGELDENDAMRWDGRVRPGAY